MSPTEVIITALIALRSNIMRTLLTMLGIIIGISAVIVLTAAGQGAQQGVANRIKGLGSNLMFIQPASGKTTTGLLLLGQGPALFLEDARAIDAAQIEGIDGVAAQSSAPEPGEPYGATVIYRGQNIDTTMLGTEPSYQYVRDFYVAEGRFITEDDINKEALVCVLGVKVRDQLFGDKDPIGEVVRIHIGPGNYGFGFNFTVVGVMEEKGATSSVDQDNVIITPLPSFQRRVPLSLNPHGTTVSQINIKVTDRSKIPQIKLAITDILRKRHNLSEGTDNDFTIQSQSDLLSTATEVDRTLSVLLVSIALISLIVGGIGIMNIMLVSVSERTREIGIRKAVGAKRRDILMQFMIEALVVTLFGGLLGVAVGTGITQILQHDFNWHINLLIRTLNVSVSGGVYVITPRWIIAGLAMSAATGLVFGVYPAWRAARLDPIEALRRE
ncbi:MAG: ABC transporter permease [Dehalococcoidia bacterium]|jgi:putative ABC transport system permease protein